MHVAHDEVGHTEAGKIVRELPVAIHEIGVAYVRLIALEVPSEAERMLTGGETRLIPKLTDISNELSVSEVSNAEESVRDAEPTKTTLALGKLVNLRAEIVKLRHIAALSAYRRCPHHGRSCVVHK